MTPREELSEMLKESRLRAGFRSQAALAKAIHLSRPVISRAENPAHPVPSDDVLKEWARVTDADLKEMREISARATGGTPEWFVPYVDAESKASLIRLWDTVHFPGLVQTEAYARAVLSHYPHAPERVAAMVEQRMGRQEVLDRARVIAVVDHRAFRDCIGSPAIMAEQCARLASLAEADKIRLHVVPEGANVGLSGAFSIASRGNAVTIAFSTAVMDITSTDPDTVDATMDLFELILTAALPFDASIDYARTWEATWKERQ